MTVTRIRKTRTERRQEIALAVLRIIGEQGLTALSTTSLAKEIGVTSGALFRHFASRDDILRETARYALETIDQTFPEETLPPMSRLFGLARNRIRLLAPDPGLAWILRSEQAYHTLPEDAVRGLREMVRRSRRYVLEALRQGAAEGSVRSDIEPEVLLVPVMATIHALIGMSGVHRLAAGEIHSDSDRVLTGLEQLLSPPAGTMARRRPGVPGPGKEGSR
jgi:AcrR family transcriptional regulator